MLDLLIYLQVHSVSCCLFVEVVGGGGGWGGRVVCITHRFVMMHCHTKFGYKRLIRKDEITEMTTV